MIFKAGRIFFGLPERQKWPPGVAESLSPWPVGWIAATLSGRIYLLFFFFGSSERQIWPLRVARSLPLAVGVDRGHPQWSDLSFFIFIFCFTEKFAGGGRWVTASVHRRWAMGHLFSWLIC